MPLSYLNQHKELIFLHIARCGKEQQVLGKFHSTRVALLAAGVGVIEAKLSILFHGPSEFCSYQEN